MSGFRSFAARVHSSEEGHSLPAVASLLGGAGVVVLGIGAAGDNDALTLVGGIVGGLGVHQARQAGEEIGHPAWPEGIRVSTCAACQAATIRRPWSSPHRRCISGPK